MKKAWDAVSVTRPTSWGSGNAHCSWTSNTEPTRVCISSPWYTLLYMIRHTAGWWIHTHGHLSLHRPWLQLKFTRFQNVKNKRQINANSIKSIPHKIVAPHRGLCIVTTTTRWRELWFMAANLLILFDIWQLLDSFFSKNVDCIQPFYGASAHLWNRVGLTWIAMP